MERLDFAAFLEREKDFNEAVRKEGEIATFCSGSIWQTAAFRSLHGGSNDSNFMILEEEGTWLVFVEKNEGVYFPLESAWMFGCPLIGEKDRAIEMLRRISRDILRRTVGFVIPGVLEDGSLHGKLSAMGKSALRYEEFPSTDCMAIDLDRGVDEWLSRRSKKFRKSIRQIKLPEGIEIKEAHSDSPEQLLDRILAIQRKTYKWREGTDIFQGEGYEAFYREIIARLHSQNDLRILFSQVEGEDAAYIFGGISGSVYRGFQMSYSDEFRNFGIGNYLQIENMKLVAADGITHYDLGMHSPYKERWADRQESYLGVFVVI